MTAYDKIKAGLEEAIAYERGEINAKTVHMSVAPVHEWTAEEIRQIRLSAGLSQRVFASAMGVSGKTVEAWEAGRNTPSGSSRRMLSMMKHDPKLLERMNIIQR